MNRRRFLRRSGAALGVSGVATFVAGRERSDAVPAASVLVAGSLQRVANRVGEATVEAQGSVACRRLLADGLRDPDAVALADPGLFAGLAPRATYFATNALVLVHRPDSPAAGRDWRAILRDETLSLGRTDPARDPLGYRTVMALELVDGVSGSESTGDSSASRRSSDGIDADAVLGRTNVFPETGLLRTLEGGGVDAAFAYRSMAVEHDLPYAPLPDHIDFSDPAFADEYASASVELSDRTVRGSPVRYAAVARTARGESWLRALAESRETLRNSGFGVPSGYPVRRTVPSE